MDTLFQAHDQWKNRPADQRFTSLTDLLAASKLARDTSRASVTSSRRLNVAPDGNGGLQLEGEVNSYALNHWSFGQLAGLAGAPAGYLRSLPDAMAADCLNYGLQVERDGQEVGLLTTDPDAPRLVTGQELDLRAATGPKYGRVWNSDIVGQLHKRFGNGIDGAFRVPGEFGKQVEVTKENTTIFGSDRDIFVFLADEERRVQIDNRRDGKAGSLARGFFVWNSEVGSQSIGAAFFLFDYVCKNRIVWGTREYKEIRMRHSSGAPDRWLSEITPVIAAFNNASASPIEATLAAAQSKMIESGKDKKDAIAAFLAKRNFTKSESAGIMQAHEREEGRPIETVWDAVTGATAYAKTISAQDDRVNMERRGGAMLDLVEL